MRSLSFANLIIGPTNLFRLLSSMVSVSVLHGPGLGPRAGPARNPWAGPDFYNSLRAGPGAGLKLAGPGRARAGK